MTALLALLNLAIPAVANVVILIKNADGSTTALISSTQTQNAADVEAIQAWLSQHQSATTPAKAS
jgi:hypothetical protein